MKIISTYTLFPSIPKNLFICINISKCQHHLVGSLLSAILLFTSQLWLVIASW